jgi:hypothetical protein
MRTHTIHYEIALLYKIEQIGPNLTRCEGLTGLPEGLSALTALQTLNLYGADLTGLKLLNIF